MVQGIHGGRRLEANLLQATQGEGGCVACHHLTCLHHVYITVHATVISQYSQYLVLIPLVLFYTCPRAKTRSFGRSIWPSGRSLLLAYDLAHNVATAIKKEVFSHLFIFFTSYFSIGENIISQKCYFLLATVLPTCFVAPCSWISLPLSSCYF